MTARSFGRMAVEHATVRIAYMGETTRARLRAAAAGLCVCATLASGGSLLLSANDAPIRLLGVSSKGSAIIIEASAPVAFAVSNPDAWTVQLDLRDVSVDGAANQVTRTDTVARVSLEQASAADGREVARVRLSLARPATYKVRSARSTIRVELGGAPAPEPSAPAAAAAPEQAIAVEPSPEPATMPVAAPPDSAPALFPDSPLTPSPVDASLSRAADTPAPTLTLSATPIPAGSATVLDRVKAARTGNGVSVTLGGDGYLAPSNVTESRDLPRRLVMDFPGVAPRAAAQTSVSGGLVRSVRIAANSRQPLITRVVMELATGVTYHVERVGDGGRDLAVMFEPPLVLVAASDAPAAAVEPEPPLTMEQALANGASLTPRDTPADPFSALQLDAARTSPKAPSVTSSPVAAAATPAGPVPMPAPVGAAPTPAPQAAAPRQQPPAVPPAPAAQSGPLAEARPSEPPAVRAEATPPPSAKPQPEPRPPATAKPQVRPPTSARQSTTSSGQQTPPAPPATQQIVGAQDKKYTGHPITMDFQGVDLRSVLRTFAEISGLNMVIDPDVQGTVDMILTDVPWDQALEVILRGNSLDYTVDGSIVRVARVDTLKKEQDSRQQLAKASADAGTLAVRTFTLSYGKAAQAAPLVKRAVLSPRGDVQIDERTNTLIITDLPARLDTVTQLLGTIDRAEPQVEVEARVVQTTREFAQAVGIQWGLNGRVAPELGNTPPIAFPNRGTLGGRTGAVNGPIGDPRAGELETTSNAVNLGVPGASSAIGLALGSINGAFNLDVALSALERSGKGRILSTPRLTTQNNIEAEVAQGIQIPIQTVANNTVTVSFKEAVLVLKVTPQITTAGTVIMRILVENATADFSRQVNGIPPIDTQRANTTVQVNDGSTTIIGGIFVSQEQYSNERTPVLHRIPLLGWLFRKDSTQDQSRELLIFITPRILKG
jgi:type IV pilus assembly protein PilQ